MAQSRSLLIKVYDRLRHPSKILIKIFSIPKSLYFCLHYFSVTTAIKLPVFVCYRTRLAEMNGEIILPNYIRPSMIKIGFGEVGIFDEKRSRTIWQVNGKIIFHGSANIGHGSRISVGKSAVVEFGDNFVITAETHLISSKSIKFGTNVLISWQCLIMDTDFHRIWIDNKVMNDDKEIEIGNHVWIGCRNTILKGVHIGDDCVIAAGSNVVRSIDETCAIIAGNPAKLVKRNIAWSVK